MISLEVQYKLYLRLERSDAECRKSQRHCYDSLNAMVYVTLLICLPKICPFPYYRTRLLKQLLPL